MTKIAIIGVGLMGGSLALCFKGKPGVHVTGFSANPASVEKYMKRGVVDSATTSLEEAAADADFIFLCVPVGLISDYLRKLKQAKLKPGCIITDVGSTKGAVMDCAARMELQDVHFIGGHPMAGSERSGVEAASAYLYENAFYVLTPAEGTPVEAYQRLADLLHWTRAQIIRVDASQHDDIVGAISHLPHVIAVALVNQIAGYNKSNELYRALAAGGFRDITRIASGDPIMWRDIFQSNKPVMLKLLADWNEEIAAFRRMIEESDGDGIMDAFRRAGKFRSELPERRKGVLTALYDLYVDVPDHPGIIGSIASLLGNSRINLSNLQIIESRDEVPGVLRLSFRNEEDVERASELLKPHYPVHV